MGNSVLVKRLHSNSAVAEHEQRLRVVQIRDRIDESGVLDLAIMMDRTGRELYIDPQTMEITGHEMLDQKTRQAYISLLMNKLVSNAVPPKGIVSEPDFSKWIDVINNELDKESGDDS